MKRPSRSLRSRLLLRVLLLLLALFLLWLTLGRPAFSAEQAVRWTAASTGCGDDYQIYLLEQVSNNDQGIPGPIYSALVRCGDQYYELWFKRVWLFLWQPFSQWPLLLPEENAPPLDMERPRGLSNYGPLLGRWAFGIWEPDLLDGSEEYQENRLFYANDPDIVRVTFTVGDTTKDAVRPEADRPFWYLAEAFPYRPSDTGYQYRGYDKNGDLIYDSGLCPFE